MSHLVSAVENALLAGRWLDAAPLLSDILSEGVPCSLETLEYYERTAGQTCESDKVRRILQTRLSLADNRAHAAMMRRVREAERLASIVREHDMPCRVVSEGRELRVACRIQNTNGHWTWIVEQIVADMPTVSAYLGY